MGDVVATHGSTSTNLDLVDRLAAHRTLGSAPRGELAWLAARGEVRLYSRGDVVSRRILPSIEMLVVLATNLDPASLADEAFLRRIPYKIAVNNPSLEQFTRIFELECRRRSLPFHQELVASLHRRHYLASGRPLRACHPRDLLDQVSALCRYRTITPTVSDALLDEACASYFIDHGEAGGRATPPVRQELPRLEVH